jgi:hypothetical protein
MPRWTYGWSNSGVPLGPTPPTDEPSEMTAPFNTPIEPRWTSVTE